MINLQLFHTLMKLRHRAGQIQQILPATAPFYGFLTEGFAYEFYRTNKNKQLVSWFWTKAEYVIPTSPYSTIVLSADAEFLDLDYSVMFKDLRRSVEYREEYAFTRGCHNLFIAERINDIKYLGPFQQYLKLQQQTPEVFDYVRKEQIASFLNIDVMELRRFMLKRPLPQAGG